MLIITKAGFILGWAKPVPYNPDNLKGGKKAHIMVAMAGILANIGLAIVFGMIVRFAPALGVESLSASALASFYKITTAIVLLNIVLAFFNLIPIPPLDGSKVLFTLLPRRLYHIQAFLEQWGMFILLFFIIFVWQYLSPLIFILFRLLTGLS
jgi:Zn-dependent protease